jgi:hypothetical protein
MEHHHLNHFSREKSTKFLWQFSTAMSVSLPEINRSSPCPVDEIRLRHLWERAGLAGFFSLDDDWGRG